MDWCINASYSGIYVVSILRDKRGGKEMCKGYAAAQEAYDRQEPTGDMPGCDWYEEEDRLYHQWAEERAIERSA